MALYGKMPSVTYQDYPDARLIVLWGVNPSASGIHLVPYVREAQKRGAKLVVIDPRTTPLARSADLHLAVRPGTDVAVALAIHRYPVRERATPTTAFLARTRARRRRAARARAAEWTFERAADVAGVDAGGARSSSPSCTRTTSPGAGPLRLGPRAQPQRRQRGDGGAGAAGVGGKFGVRGGGYSMSNSASWDIDRTWIDAPEPATRVVNMNHLGRALTEYDDPPVKRAVRLQLQPGGDRARSAARPARPRARGSVHGRLRQVMTDTALYADVVLPATTFLEGYDFAKALRPDHPAISAGR